MMKILKIIAGAAILLPATCSEEGPIENAVEQSIERMESKDQKKANELEILKELARDDCMFRGPCLHLDI